MFGSVWAPLGGKVADRWATLLLSPVLAFWGGGLLAWVWSHGGFGGAASGWTALERQWRQAFATATPVAEVALIVVALLVVAASARLVESLTLPALRVLEGYWPPWAGPLRTALVRARGRRIDRDAERWRALAVRQAELSPAERSRYARLDARRAAVPPLPGDRMPTRLGDLLRAAERRPRQRYGLETVVCWPRLWLVLPEQARADVGAVRARVDEAARLWVVGLAFAVWVFLTWWALVVALAVMMVAYRMLLSAAADYTVLLQSCFDLHRKILYEELGVAWETREEPGDGERVTAFLARGAALDGGREA
ncbi:hypothetical protein ACIBEJ_46210 [Nonomuraea sp. NPDC050790]|uniref:hypothetical protein n=1 Tax=Nonomuraea sp. NPDC050790 TaxID=3364371 RepID=UPI0037922A75